MCILGWVCGRDAYLGGSTILIDLLLVEVRYHSYTISYMGFVRCIGPVYA